MHFRAPRGVRRYRFEVNKRVFTVAFKTITEQAEIDGLLGRALLNGDAVTVEYYETEQGTRIPIRVITPGGTWEREQPSISTS